MRMVIFLVLALLTIFFKGKGQDIGAAINAANKYYAEKQFQKAASLYKEALAKVPNSLIVQYNYGNASFKSGNYNEAIKAFQMAGRAHDKHLAQLSLYNLGNALVKRQRLEEALAAFKNAVLLDSNDRLAKENLQFVINWLKNNSNSKNNNGQSDTKKKVTSSKDDAKAVTAMGSESASMLSKVQKQEEMALQAQHSKTQGRNKQNVADDW